jgi:tetratricopeptide (TPR) repeat protein
VQRTFAALLTVLAVVAVAVPAAGAAPDPRTESAREHSRQGDAYYKLEKYPNAIGEYEQAYLAKPDPSFLFNIAQCHRLMGQGAEAIKFYRRFLADAPDSLPSRGIAEKHIHDLEEAGRSETQQPPAGAVTVAPPADARPVTPLPPAAPPPSTAPPPTVPAPVATTAIALAPANPALAAPTSTTPAVETSAPPPAGESHPFYTRWWFWTAVGAVVVTGIVVGLAASGRDPSCPGGFVCHQ